MQQRGAGKPGHQGSILDRVPEPPAAPAELVIGPVRTHRDAEREEDPRHQRPRPHPARPGRIDAAFDQRGHRKGERDREPDIAEIEHRRMHREANVLQHRVEVAALDRRARDAQKRIRGDEDEQIECSRDPALHRQHMRTQRQRQIVAESGDQAAEQRQDKHPEQHRSFVIAPHAGDLVEQRLHRVRILEHVDDGEIRHHVQHRQQRKRRRHEQQLRERTGASDIHQGMIAAARAEQRHGGLDQRQSKRQHQRVMPGFRDHFEAPCTGAAEAAAPGLAP